MEHETGILKEKSETGMKKEKEGEKLSMEFRYRERERDERERERGERKGEVETVKRVWAEERGRDRATRILKERVWS